MNKLTTAMELLAAYTLVASDQSKTQEEILTVLCSAIHQDLGELNKAAARMASDPEFIADTEEFSNHAMVIVTSEEAEVV